MKRFVPVTEIVIRKIGFSQQFWLLGCVTTDFFQAWWDNSTEAPERNCQSNPLQGLSKEGPEG